MSWCYIWAKCRGYILLCCGVSTTTTYHLSLHSICHHEGGKVPGSTNLMVQWASPSAALMQHWHSCRLDHKPFSDQKPSTPPPTVAHDIYLQPPPLSCLPVLLIPLSLPLCLPPLPDGSCLVIIYAPLHGYPLVSLNSMAGSDSGLPEAHKDHTFYSPLPLSLSTHLRAHAHTHTRTHKVSASSRFPWSSAANTVTSENSAAPHTPPSVRAAYGVICPIAWVICPTECPTHSRQTFSAAI